MSASPAVLFVKTAVLTAVLWSILQTGAPAAVARPAVVPGPAATVASRPASNGVVDARLLYLNSYHYGYEWSDSVSIGAMQVFRQSAPEARVYIEYLDSKHFELTDDRRQAEADRLLKKYGADFFDVVIVSDDPALDFIREYRDVLVPGKPVVFCGINVASPDGITVPEGFTGIIEPFDYHGIVSMVSKVFPQRRTGYLIVDNSLTGRNIVDVARRLVASEPGFTLNVLDGAELSHDELLQTLRGLGPDAFVVVGLWLTDRNGHYLNVSEAFQDITNASTAPVFVILRTSLSLGYAGGAAVSGVHQGRVAAGMALDILGGKPVSEIPVSDDNVFDLMLNRSVIENRWKIDWNSLPDEIRKIPDSFPMESEAPRSPVARLTPTESRYISAHAVVNVGIIDIPPLMRPGSTPSGVIVEFLDEIGRMVGIRFRYLPCGPDLSGCTTPGIAGQDAPILPFVTESADGLSGYTFSAPYSHLQSMIFTRDDSGAVLNLRALKGRKVAVAGHGYLYRQLLDEIDGLSPIVFESSRQALIALNDGTIDAYVGPISVGVTQIRDMGFKRIRIAAPTNLPDQPLSIAVPIDQPLLASIIDKGIGAMPPDLFDRLRDRHLENIEFKVGWATEAVLKLLLCVTSGFLVVVLILLMRARRLKRASYRRELNLQVTLDSIGDAVIVTNPSGIIQRMNPVALKLTGWSGTDATGRRLEEVMALVDLENNQPVPLAAAPDGASDNGVDHPAYRTQLNGRDGAKYLVEANAYPIIESNGVGLGQVVVFRDISRRLQIQDQIQHSRKMEAIGQLAGGVAHDFNNMLSAIQGYSELILGKLPAGSNEVVYCQRILNATERAAGLTSKLLDFARKGKALSTAIDVHESIRSALALLERSIDKTIVITSSLLAEHPLIVGDPGQLQSIILNLCINARDAMPNGGTLEIRTTNVFLSEADCRSNEFPMTPGEHIQISVMDNGTGIPPKDLEHIFEPFFTTKEVGKGTGLGLAAVHGAIVEHSGSINVYSEVGRGTQFNIYLPVSAENGTRVDDVYITPRRHSGTVLIVEDEPLIRGMAEIMFKDMGFDVLVAENGAIGVDTFRKHADIISLVMMDVIMPEMDGMTALKAIRKIKPGTVFIVTSGFSFEHRREEFMKAGAAAFIGKPFRNSELMKAVDDCLKD